jgi:hypothetical protein
MGEMRGTSAMTGTIVAAGILITALAGPVAGSEDTGSPGAKSACRGQELRAIRSLSAAGVEALENCVRHGHRVRHPSPKPA